MESNSKVEKMIYHNRSSTDFGIYLNFPEPYIFSQRESTRFHVPGRSGDIIEDNEAYQNPTLTIAFTVIRPEIYPTWFSWETDVSNWLDGDDYSYLKLDGQDDYVWEAYMDTAPTVTPETGRSASGTLSFSVKPFLLKSASTVMQDVPLKAGTVYNHESQISYPDWEIVTGGTNDASKTFTITVNGADYVFTGVTGTVFVDGENCQVTSDGNMINDLVQFANNDSPILIPGDNTVAFSGDNVVSVKYAPKWRRKA